MKQKINFLLITMLFTLCLSACGKQPADQTDVTADRETLSETEQPETEAEDTDKTEPEKTEPEQPETDKTEREETAPEQAAAGSAEGFDMERISKSIIIKGQPFEVPVALCDLGEGWTWEEEWTQSDGGGALVYIYYEGEQWFGGTVENYYAGAEDQGSFYNLTIETDDCSIDGFVPYITTKQEVMEKYGEPLEIWERTGEYFYGFYGISHDGYYRTSNEQGLAIKFNDDDTVKWISIVYSIYDNE